MDSVWNKSFIHTQLPNKPLNCTNVHVALPCYDIFVSLVSRFGKAENVLTSALGALKLVPWCRLSDLANWLCYPLRHSLWVVLVQWITDNNLIPFIYRCLLRHSMTPCLRHKNMNKIKIYIQKYNTNQTYRSRNKINKSCAKQIHLSFKLGNKIGFWRCTTKSK